MPVNNQVNVLIVEDEGIVALSLEDTLQIAGYHVSGIADNGKEAVGIMKKEMVDLALLDIKINGDWDGIETARQLTRVKDIPFIYLTAFVDTETLNRAKVTNPSAYLSKPYQSANLLIAMELALHNFSNKKNKIQLPASQPDKNMASSESHKEQLLFFNNTIFIKQNFTFIKIDLNDIYYLEASGNYTHLYTKDKKQVIRFTLNTVLDKLKYPDFVRVHRSYAVNMHHLDTFDEHHVQLNNYEIPLGRSYKEELFRRFDFL